MNNLPNIGRIFFAIAIIGLGLQTIIYRNFPYMLFPPKHSWIPSISIIACVFGAFLLYAGICISISKKSSSTSLILGFVLLLIFCFGFVPYQIMSNTYLNWGEWETAEKELALAAGAFVIAGCLIGNNENPFLRFLAKQIPLGAIIFSLTIVCFGIDHFLYAADTADYMPTWVPFKTFWVYFAGSALIGSGIGIILNIKRNLAGTLLGIMIFIWVIILHIPKVIYAPTPPEMRGELASAFLALAYSGIAFVIALPSPYRRRTQDEVA